MASTIIHQSNTLQQLALNCLPGSRKIIQCLHKLEKKFERDFHGEDILSEMEEDEKSAYELFGKNIIPHENFYSLYYAQDDIIKCLRKVADDIESYNALEKFLTLFGEQVELQKNRYSTKKNQRTGTYEFTTLKKLTLDCLPDNQEIIKRIHDLKKQLKVVLSKMRTAKKSAYALISGNVISHQPFYLLYVCQDNIIRELRQAANDIEDCNGFRKFLHIFSDQAQLGKVQRNIKNDRAVCHDYCA
ncbi:hypothetical protein RVIR1_10290 [Candidatus Rickettsiella viridis]|uniref:Uncharacterized protein n=1 Tax=Candidatus Rickettsiella viridis TaxID=676208 RepID=A0A2Z5UWS2_9COXI|nr:hypothetical protein [Candidatus Rickettsiella viridis]BBB14771.1 hypothetical protein RVIR1_02390 [Candidatus Rickettsiella viridis]BBB15501.1 hypothetical protein RVIR1_10290 [Candidatus Rickettsiella viridis]